MSYINLQKRIDLARQKKREDHLAKEVAKQGTLRAGSTGAMAPEGDIIGACHRTSLLRSMGMELEVPSWDKFIMFELGYANEDEVVKQLQETLEEGEILLREEEIPIKWETETGMVVSGRPDIVICNNKATLPTQHSMLDIITITGPEPILGIELKSVHSLWTAREVLFNKSPKLNNLLQAAHYMWKLGDIPYKLFYKSYSQLGQGMSGNEWISKMFPKPDEPGSEFIEWSSQSEAQAAKGKAPTIKHIKQFEIIYDLEFDRSGRLKYRIEGSKGPWTSTIIMKQDIGRYFEYVSTMEQKKELGPRPTSVDAVGDALNYKACKYCPLQETCNKFEKAGYDTWIEEVKKTAGQVANKSK